ncbi:hypothetical protein IKX12_01610 [Candidatus Saccharibacteria bacterium]|nr:hypothetical protein [Candidatus Saccharibacteria bacterium]
MQWEFSWGWFFIGVAVIIAGLLVVKFHQWIGDNMANGVASYDKIKLIGIIACVVGAVFMSNLHSLLLYFIMHLVAPTRFP